MASPAENHTQDQPTEQSLPERFWSLARGMEVDTEEAPDPVAVVKHVLAVMDAFERGETSGEDVSIRTLSFLRLLRQAELRGEISYAAPEQLRGETVNERSLVFSVGVLLFERLTGRHPFGAEGNRPRRMARMQKGEFGSGVNYFPTVPPGLRRILMRAMGPFPDERWDNLKEMRKHLEEFVSHTDPGVRLPGTAPPQPRKQSVVKKNRTPPKPASDTQTTRVVDMSERVKMEQEAVARHRAHDDLTAAPALTPAAGPASAYERADTVLELGGRDAGSNSEPGRAKLELVHRKPAAAGEFDSGTVINVRPRGFGAAAPVAWALLGAAIATLVFLLFFRTEEAPVAARAQTILDQEHGVASAGPSAGMTVSIPASAPIASASTASASATGAQPAPVPAAPARPQAKGVPASSLFDPQHAGERALDAVLSCFAPAERQHGIAFGAGLLFDRGDGHVRKVYFAGTEELTGEQRKCFRDQLADFSSATPPERNQIVDYQFRIREDERSVKARESK